MAEFGEGEGELLSLEYPRPLPMRLDRWLVSQRPEQSRARIQKFIDAGYVRVNGVTGRAKTPLRPGDAVQLWMPPPEPLPYLKPEAIPLDVLFEDAHLIVLNKPAGLTVHPAPGNKDGTLVNGLLHHCPDLPGIGGEMRPGIVHRLDKDTTGCIVIAKSQEALVRLQVQIQKRIASREYLGVVHGALGSEAGTVIGAIASFWLLSVAMKDLPVGTAYAVWVGIGAVGTAILAVMLFGEPVSPMRVAGILLIVAGITALKFA